MYLGMKQFSRKIISKNGFPYSLEISIRGCPLNMYTEIKTFFHFSIKNISGFID